MSVCRKTAGWNCESLSPYHHISRADFEPNALDAADKLCAAGYEVYIVGGAIRDIILSKSANDFDISRRDLTINALYYDIKTNEIVD